MEYKDYYTTLGVPRGASQADIKKAYRRLAREHHPDVNKGNAAAERRFKEINEANAVLGDPEKRRAYDALGADWAAYQQAGGTRGADPFADFMRQSGGAGPGGVRFEFHGSPEDMAGFSEFFQSFFGGGPVETQTVRTRTGTATERGSGRGSGRRIGFDIEDLLGGLGRRGHGDEATAAGATGRPQRTRRNDREVEAEITLEEAFRGTSRILEVGDRRLEVAVPAGVADGQRIRLANTAGGGAGDIYVKVRVMPHPAFERSGADLTRELPVTLREALLGGEVPVETLAGGRLLLKVPPGTQPGRTIRLAGQGLPRFRADGRGDLYVRIRVVLPTGLDGATREQAARFLDSIDQPDPRGSNTAHQTTTQAGSRT